MKAANIPARLGDLQLRIMKVLWRRGQASVADVHGELGADRLAYTTVATMLRKMEDRRLVRHREEKSEGRSRRFIYEAVLSAGDVTRRMATDLVDRLFEGSLATAVEHLLTARQVSRDELAELERLIRDHRRDRGA
jgi:BlaI family penicillinase repressor